MGYLLIILAVAAGAFLTWMGVIDIGGLLGMAGGISAPDENSPIFDRFANFAIEYMPLIIVGLVALWLARKLQDGKFRAMLGGLFFGVIIIVAVMPNIMGNGGS